MDLELERERVEKVLDKLGYIPQPGDPEVDEKYQEVLNEEELDEDER